GDHYCAAVPAVAKTPETPAHQHPAASASRIVLSASFATLRPILLTLPESPRRTGSVAWFRKSTLIRACDTCGSAPADLPGHPDRLPYRFPCCASAPSPTTRRFLRAAAGSLHRCGCLYSADRLR